MPVDRTAGVHHVLPHLSSLLLDVALDSPLAIGVRLCRADRLDGDFGDFDDFDDFDEDASSVELAFRSLDCDDVICALAGFVAPDEWDAFGVVAPGRQIPQAPRAANAASAESVSVSVFVDRFGERWSEMRTSTGDVIAQGDVDGRVVDACRRVLGLPTGMAPCTPSLWLASCWLDRVLNAVLDADIGTSPPWPVLAALDPSPVIAATIAAWLGEHAELSWTVLRMACALERIEVPGVCSHVAGWADDALFAREAVGVFAPIVDVLGDLRELVPQHVFDRIIERACERLGD